MSVTETELIIAEDGLVISNGQTSSGLSIQGGNYVTVEGGGVLTDSLVKEVSMVVVDPGGVVRDTSAEGDSLIYVDGTAERLTVKDTGAFDIDPGCTLSSATILKDGVGTIKYNASATDVSVSGAGGQFVVNGGSAFKTVVADGGLFVVQNVQSKIDGENRTFTGLAQSTTIADGGMMSVLSGAVAQDTTMTGGMFHVSSGTASNTTVTGGTMTVYVGVPVQDTVLNGGKMVVSNGSATNTTVNEGAAVSAFGGEIVNATVAGGELYAKDANVSGLTVTGGSVALEASLLAGKSVFAEGASVTVDGTIWFDTQYTTETDAQIKGAFTAGPDTEYMLDAEPVIGVYLLADSLPSFNGAVTFDKYTLKLDEEPVKVGDLVYSLNQNGTALELSIAEYVPDGATLLYVDTAWSKLKNGATVTIGGITATVGTNAFASGDAAALAAAEIEGAKIRVTGGTVFFTDPIAVDTAVYSGAALTNSGDGTLVVAAGGKLAVNKGATVTGKAVFEEGASITINGTVLFDTQYVTKDDPESVQITLSAVPDGKAAFTLNATAPEIGAYRLLAGVPSFADEVAFGDNTLTVGGAAVTLGGLNYALTLAGEENDILVLNVTEYDGKDTEPPVITVNASETEPTCLDVVLTATFTDNVGVTVAQYKLVKEGEDEAEIAWSDYTLGGVTVKDNNATVYFFGADAAGNTASQQYTVTNIDRSLDDEPPTITDVHADTTELTDHVVVTATFADNVGVTLAQYKLGEDGEWTDYPDGGVTVTDNLTVYFRASDAKGLSATNEYKVTNIDKPDVEGPTLVGEIVATPSTATNLNVVVTAEFTDNVGVVSVKYKLGEDGGWAICPDDGVLVTTNDTTVYFQAFDAADNPSEIASYTVTNIDRIPPEKPSASADITSTTDQPVTVSAVFSEDSVTKEYRVDDGEWAAYLDGGVTVTENCVVSFRAFDAAGNESLIAGYTVSNISHEGGDDKTPPTLSYAKADITKPTNKDVTVTALFGDNVGVVSTEYRIGEDGAWTDYPAGGVTLSENAVVYFRAFDAAGNQSEIASCAVTNIDKTLPDGQAKVYVNVDWATLDPGTPVETYDTSFATVGVNAFATADEANAAVDPSGYISLEKGTLSFTEAAHNVVLQAEEAVQLVVNNEAGLDKVWVYDHGTITMTKGVMTGCKVLGGNLTVESGAIVDGLTADAPSYQSNSVLVSGAIARNVVVGCLQTMLDMEYNCSMSVVGKDGLLQIASVTSGGHLFVSVGAKAENVNVTGGGLLTVVDARAENVVLAGDPELSSNGSLNVTDGGMASGITVSSGGCVNGNYGAIINDILLLKGGQVYMEETTGSKAIVNDIMYLGRLASFCDINVNEGGTLYTLNSAGIGTAYDTEVQFGGSMQNGGYASNTQVLDGGKMEITSYGLAEDTTVRNGGALDISGYYAVYEDKVYESNGIARDLTVESGAVVNVTDYGKLTGRLTFENGATVAMAEKSVLDFDISSLKGTEETPLLSDYSVVTGAPELTLTVSATQYGGTYLLAGGATLFDSGIALGEYTLTVGGEAVEYGNASYSLALSGDSLVLTVTGDGPTPPTPAYDTVYVNSEWAGITEPTVTFTDGEGNTVTATFGVDAFTTGDAAVEKAATLENPMVEVVGGEVSFTDPITEPITIDEGATLSGKATFVSGATVNGTIAFDTDDAQDGAQFTGFENVELGDDAQITLTVGELAAGAKVALTDAPTTKTDKNKNPLFGRKVSVTVNGEDDDQYEIGSVYFAAADGISHVLDLDKNGQLVLSEVTQRRENNDNDTLVKSKQPNASVIGEEVPATILTLENPEVFIDPKGEVKQAIEGGKTFYNFVNGTTDKADYAQIVVEHGARLSFTLSSTDKAKIALYSVSTNSKGQWSQKSLKSASVTKAGVDKNTAVVYVTAGTYYVGVTNSNKKTSGAFYNVTLNTASSYIYADADNNWNDYVVKSKALNPNLADLNVTTITETGTQSVLFDDAPLTLDPTDKYENFVGYTDTVDFAKISSVQPVGLTFTLNATGKATLNVYSLSKNSKGVWTQSKSLKSIKITAKAGGEKSSTVLYLDRLLATTGAEATGYYVSVTSSDKKGNVNYNVSVASQVFEDSDFGTNGVLLTASKVPNDKLASTTINATKTDITTEVINGEDAIVVSKDFNDKTYESFVGLGDQYDYAEVVLNGTGKLTLSLDTYGTTKSTAKVTLYKLTQKSNGTWSKSSVGTLSVKTDGTYGTGTGSKDLTIKAATSATVRYFVGVESVDAKKGKEMYYNLSASFTGAASSALDMPQDDLLAQTFDSFANTASFVDSSLVDDKQFALQSVPGLIA